MVIYRNFRPTPEDNHKPIEDREDWLVAPVGRNRDSSLIELSNFDTMMRLLGGKGDDVDVRRFPHWACGHYEIVLVRPDSEAAAKAEDMEEQLADHPVLDEEDLSNREHEAAMKEWEDFAAVDFIRDELGFEGDADTDLKEGWRDILLTDSAVDYEYGNDGAYWSIGYGRTADELLALILAPKH